jgi:hypothetical protein
VWVGKREGRERGREGGEGEGAKSKLKGDELDKATCLTCMDSPVKHFAIDDLWREVRFKHRQHFVVQPEAQLFRV